jgi:hypothetical protein
VELAERAADGEVLATRLTAHQRKMMKSPRWKLNLRGAADLLAAKCVVRLATRRDGPYFLRSATATLLYALASDEAGLCPAEWMEWEARPGNRAVLAEPARITCGLIREVLGDPFSPLMFPKRWPATLQGLARSLYEGEDCRLPLRDALLDADQRDLVQHFEQPWHPRGCWALDVMLKLK